MSIVSTGYCTLDTGHILGVLSYFLFFWSHASRRQTRHIDALFKEAQTIFFVL